MSLSLYTQYIVFLSPPESEVLSPLWTEILVSSSVSLQNTPLEYVRILSESPDKVDSSVHVVPLLPRTHTRSKYGLHFTTQPHLLDYPHPTVPRSYHGPSLVLIFCVQPLPIVSRCSFLEWFVDVRRLRDFCYRRRSCTISEGSLDLRTSL